MRKSIAVAATLAAFATGSTLAQVGAASPAATAAHASNPLLTPSPLPLQFPPFDKITDADFAPALDQGMAAHLAEIEQIANNPAPASFDNTIIAMERSGACSGAPPRCCSACSVWTPTRRA